MSSPHSLLVGYGWFLGVGAVAAIVLWQLVWVRVGRATRGIPTLQLGQALAAAQAPTGRVCVVVPAHNEARVIATLVRSLRGETYRDLRVVLALDRCTDDTAELARAAFGDDCRFEIVAIDSCPSDWAGKVHAVHVGVTRSRGAADAEYLLFADADTVFAPGCIAAALALMRERKLDFLSLLSTLTYRTWFERVVQLAATLELMRQYPLTLANAATSRRPFANGQFMLFSRVAYEDVGGHAAVKSALLEDIALARRIDARKRAAGLFLAAGLFHCSMYGDWPQFRRGWKRIYTEAADRNARRLAHSALRTRWLGTLVPLWMLAGGPVGLLLVAASPAIGWTLVALWSAAMTVWLGTLVRIAIISRAPVWIAPLHIVGAWLVAGVLDEAATDIRSRTPTRWGGREYDLGV
ncbi:MAG TPA: glycosyltransferase family 2 protein [Casimicrobiaceae bacterium]|nr:glycosyltransferase family 2 protein [Casimicrobiaceae bacterium]